VTVSSADATVVSANRPFVLLSARVASIRPAVAAKGTRSGVACASAAPAGAPIVSPIAKAKLNVAIAATSATPIRDGH
jgi:hypothetical protein